MTKEAKKQAIAELKKELKEKLKNKKRKHVRDFKPPIYDEIYFEGLEKLDALAE